MRIVLSTVAVSALLVLPGAGARADLTGTDRDFVTKAMQDNMAELQKAQWAEKAEASQPLKVLVQKIIKNHSNAYAQLRTMAENQQFALPNLPRIDQQQTRDELKNTDVQQIQAAYTKEEIDSHQRQIALYQQEIDNGKNSEVRDYAKQFLPVLQDELKSAQKLQPGG